MPKRVANKPYHYVPCCYKPLYGDTIDCYERIGGGQEYNRTNMGDILNLNLSKLIQQSYSGITLLDQSFKVLYRTPSASAITGWTDTDLKDVTMMDMVHEGDRTKLAELLANIIGLPGFSQIITFRIKHQNGHYIWLECTFINMLNEHDLKAIVCNFIDVTEKKQDQELLQETLKELSAYKKALDEAAIVAITDQKGVIKHVNQNFCDISGYTAAELIGNDHRIINSAFHDPSFMKELWRTIAGGQIWKGELRNRAKDGSIYWVDTSIVPFLNDQGKPYQYVAIRSDITERKLREIELKKTSETLTDLLETISDGYISLDKEMRYTYANKQIGKILGIDVSTLIGRNIWEVFPDAVGSATYTAIRTAFTENRYVSNEDHYEPLHLWQENRIYPTSDGIAMFIRDITQMKLEQQHLRLLESAITNTTDAVLIMENTAVDHLAPRIAYINNAFTEMSGYASEEILGLSPGILQGEKTEHTELDRIRQLLKAGECFEATLINYHKNGRPYWVNMSIAPVHDNNGVITHFVSTQRDVTAKRTHELETMLLAEISMIFNTSFCLNEILDHILKRLVDFGSLSLAEAWLVNSDKKHIDLKARHASTPQAEKFYTVTPHINSFERGIGLPGYVWHIARSSYWPDIVTHAEFVRKAAAMEAGLKTAYGIPLKAGAEVIGVLILSSDNNKELRETYTGFFDRFSSHLGSEIKRKQLEHDLEQIFASVPDLICVVGTDRKIKTANPAMCELLGYSYEQITSSMIDDLIHADDLQNSKDRMKAFMQSKELSLYFENRYITKRGKVKWLAWTATAGSEPGVLFCVAKDITEKKELEDLLNKANTLASIGGWEVDLLTNTVYWSPITRLIHEVDDAYTPEVEKGLSFYKEGIDRDLISQQFFGVIDHGQPIDAEARIVTAKGNVKWVRVIGEAEFVNQNCVRVYGSFQDIDTRKRAQLDAQYALEEKNTILESIGDGFFAVDKDWTVTYWNNSASEVMNLEKDTVLGHNLWELFPAAAKSISYKMYHEALNTKVPVHFNDYYVPLDTWYEVSAYPSADGLSIYFKDVTERVNYVKAIEDQNRKFNQISWLQSHVVRAPLCRLTGLVQLLQTINIREDEYDEVLSYILGSANELDEVIKNITVLSVTDDTTISGRQAGSGTTPL